MHNTNYTYMGVFILFICKSLSATESFYLMISKYHNTIISWCPHIIIWFISTSHLIIWSRYHIIIILSQHQTVEVIFGPKGWGRFWCQVKDFDTYWVIYPFSKEVSPKIRVVRVITFDDGAAIADQKFIAPPKPHFVEKKIDPENFCRNFVQNFFSASKNEKLQIVQNAFCQSLAPIRALFGG